MLLTVLIGFTIYFHTADTSHFRYNGRIDPYQVQDIYMLDPLQDPALIYYTGERAKTQEEKRQKILRENERKEREAAAIRLRSKAFALPSGGLILAGILNLPRQKETGPIDGCAKIQKGLTNSGGFMLFTCEKLLPDVPISKHAAIAKKYGAELRKFGWKDVGGDKTTSNFKLRGPNGCNQSLKLMVWTDRSMNEGVPKRKKRDNYRQIVFLTQFSGEACERYYPIVKALASPT